MRVYLAGAIDLVSEIEAKGWRRQAARTLERYGITVLDPTEVVVPDPTPENVFEADEALLATSDAVLAEHAFPVPHYGTTVEIEESVQIGRPVVVWHGQLGLPLYLLRHGDAVAVEADLQAACLRIVRLASQAQKEA